MRFTLAISIVAAAIYSVSAQNCNPSYNVTTSSECFTNCNIKTGQDFLPGWTMDPKSPKFLNSLNLLCTKGTPEYTAFKAKAGMCMMSCTDPQELYINEFTGACAWYATHKDDVCNSNETTTAATTGNPAAASHAAQDGKAANAANKVKLCSFTIAMVASTGYLAL